MYVPPVTCVGRTRGGSVVGRVIDRTTSEPVADVRVILLDDIWREASSSAAFATTDADGRFKRDSVPGVRRIFKFTPPAPYTTRRAYATAEDDTEADMGDVLLSSGATIAVNVVEMPGSVPAADRTVTLAGQGRTTSNQTLKTDAEGRVLFTNLATGTYSVSSGDIATRVEELRDDDQREVHLQVGSATLRGHLLRAGEPMAGSLRLSAFKNGTAITRTGIADSSGRFEINGVFPGPWRLQIVPGGSFIAQPAAKALPYEMDIDLGAETERTFEYPSGTFIVAVTTDDGEPIEAAEVAVQPTGTRSNFTEHARPQTPKASSASTA